MFGLLVVFGCAEIRQANEWIAENEKTRISVEELEERHQKYLKKIDKLEQEIKAGMKKVQERDQIIVSTPIELGLTRGEVVALWGVPNKINNSVGAYGTHEQWVYRLNTESIERKESRYLYFENGILTGYQD